MLLHQNNPFNPSNQWKEKLFTLLNKNKISDKRWGEDFRYGVYVDFSLEWAWDKLIYRDDMLP
jgi:hypothetical protein